MVLNNPAPDPQAWAPSSRDRPCPGRGHPVGRSQGVSGGPKRLEQGELQLCSSRSGDRPAPPDECVTPGRGVRRSHLSGRLTGGRGRRALKGVRKEWGFPG